MKFLRSAVIVALSVTTYCLGSNVASVQKDVNHLTSNITAFTSALSDFEPTSLASAIPLVLSAQGILQALTEATTDAKGLPKPVSNAAGLINAIKPLSNTIPNALTSISSAKIKFAAVQPGGSVAVGGVSGVLVALQSLVQTLTTAAVAALPTGQQSSLTSVQNTINTAFASAIGTYGIDICAK